MALAKIVQIVAAGAGAQGFDEVPYFEHELYALLENGMVVKLRPTKAGEPNEWEVIDPPVIGENVKPAYDGQVGNWKRWNAEGEDTEK